MNDELDGSSADGVKTGCSEDATRVALPAACIIHDAVALRDYLLPFVEEIERVVLEAEALERIDTAGVQILAAFIQSRRRSGKETFWQSPNPVLASSAELLGAAKLLSLTDVQE